MNKHYFPRDIALIDTPITAGNSRNAHRHPAVELGVCTPSQLLGYARVPNRGPICIMGNPARGISVADALIRRSHKPFLLIGPAADRESVFATLRPDWTLDAVQSSLPRGNGAIFLAKPCSVYLDLCACIEEWSAHYFIILHCGGGLQIGPEVLNLLTATQQCLLFCDALPQSLRHSETRTLTAGELMSQMSCLLVHSAGAATKDLIDLLPTYQYEKVSNTMNVNHYTGRTFLHPLHRHRGGGVSMGQTRTTEYKKSLFEMDELQRIFDDGVALVYVAESNGVYLAQIA